MKATNQSLCRWTQSTKNRPSPRPPPEMAPVSCGCSLSLWLITLSPALPISLSFVLISHSAMVGKFLSSYVFLSLVEFPSVNSIWTPGTTSWLDWEESLSSSWAQDPCAHWQMLTGLRPTLPDPPSFPTKATLLEFKRPRASGLLDGIHYNPYNDSHSRGSKDATPPDCTYLYKL